MMALPALGLVACGAASSPGSGGGAGSTPSPSPSAVTCVALPASIGPDVSGSLGPTNNGGSFCLHVGERVSVFLSVPPAQADTAKWAAITASDGTVLQPVPNGALTLVRGVTAGIFAGERAGTSRLSSTRPSGQAWRVTIVVGR
jgi:hypothetical protein